MAVKASGCSTMDVAGRVLRDQQSVQRFAQRGKHRFLITNAGLLRWRQSRNATLSGDATCGVQVPMKQQLRRCCMASRVSASRDCGVPAPHMLRNPR
ncbi:hypothetical protein [Burkholderia stabilis]|uniref:hypothetical protein n=1 Tax=Burkholderia stabilis TaxID=95485 RepID=UPI001E292B27|nr:hypothetical protein [Burkholderia stabilis]